MPRATSMVAARCGTTSDEGWHEQFNRFRRLWRRGRRRCRCGTRRRPSSRSPSRSRRRRRPEAQRRREEGAPAAGGFPADGIESRRRSGARPRPARTRCWSGGSHEEGEQQHGHSGRISGPPEAPPTPYRSTHKHTACGPSVGVVIRAGASKDCRHVYCDALGRLGTWAEMAARGQIIVEFCVSSIVEGADEEVSPIYVPVEPADTLAARYYAAAVEEVDNQASAIWARTHGCEGMRRALARRPA
ncbi:MAG: hypothetical protein MZV70_14230 [Desulfobacterales bacterium]|nr:hypothetical protein [Desulfobacterales bacterium]